MTDRDHVRLAELVAALSLGIDLGFGQPMEHVLRQSLIALRLAAGMRQLGAGNPPLHRFRLGLEFVISGRREVDGMIAHHAAIARTLAEQLELPDAVLDALSAAYEQWDGRGWPGELDGEGIPIASRIAVVAEYVEVANRLGGVEAVRALARERRGEQFDPTVVDLLDVRRARPS